MKIPKLIGTEITTTGEDFTIEKRKVCEFFKCNNTCDICAFSSVDSFQYFLYFHNIKEMEVIR